MHSIIIADWRAQVYKLHSIIIADWRAQVYKVYSIIIVLGVPRFIK